MLRDYGYFEEDKLGKPYDLKLLRRLFPHIRPYRVLLLISIVLVSAITILDLALPYLTKEAIDRYIVHSARDDDSEALEQQRSYRSDLRIPENARVVSQYPGLFEIEGAFAKISYQDLAKLKKSDLAVLRMADHEGVIRIALIFLVVVLCHFVLSIGNVMVMEYAGQSIMHDLRVRLFEHIQDLSAAFLQKIRLVGLSPG